LATDAETPRAKLAAELLDRPAHGSTAARVKAFVAERGGCRARFISIRWPSFSKDRFGAMAKRFAANLHQIRHPSLRHYVRARELKAAGMNWTEVPAVEAENPRARLSSRVQTVLARGGAFPRASCI